MTTGDVRQGQGVAKHANSGHQTPLTNINMRRILFLTWGWEITTTAETHLPQSTLLTSGATQLTPISEQTTVTQVKKLTVTHFLSFIHIQGSSYLLG